MTPTNTSDDDARNAQRAEIRLNDDETLDEVVATAASVHLEQMNKNVWCLVVEIAGWRITVWLSARGKISADYRDCPVSEPACAVDAVAQGDRDDA